MVIQEFRCYSFDARNFSAFLSFLGEFRKEQMFFGGGDHFLSEKRHFFIDQCINVDIVA